MNMWSHRSLIFSDYLPWTSQRLSKKALTDKLVKISPEGRIVTCDFKSPENFDVCVKCCVEPGQPMTIYGEFAGEWVRRFSNFTSTTWIVKSTFPRLKKFVYRKVFACQRSSLNNKRDPDNGTNQDCRAKIEFKMQLLTKNAVRKDALLLEGMNMTITVSFHHSHAVFEEEALMALKVSPETDLKLQQYLNTGCSGPGAKFFLELMLFDEHGDDPEIMSNGSLNPSLRHVTYLVGKMHKEGQGPRQYYSLIREKKSLLADTGTFITFNNNEEHVTIITPTMKRTMEEFGFYHVIIDTTSIPNGPNVHIAYVPTNIGALPIACCIENLVKKHDFAFDSLKRAICADVLCDFNPNIVMFNKTIQMKLLHLSLQNESSKKLCAQYELCRSSWCWLNDDDHEIDKNVRHSLMGCIRRFLYAKTEETANKLYKALMEDQFIMATPALKKHLESLWNTHKQWMCEDEYFYGDLVEMSIRYNKEFLVRRCKAFNVCLMVDVITKILENHQRRFLRSVVENKDIIKTCTKFLTKSKVTEDKESNQLMFDGLELKQISEHEYRIGGQTSTKFLTLRTDTMFCDCLYGSRGEFCEHLAAIINTVDSKTMTPPKLSVADTLRYTHIAGKVDENGELKPEGRLYEPYNSEEDDFDIRDVRGVAVPLHDAREFLPPTHDSDDDYDEDLYWERDRPRPVRVVRFGPRDPRFNFFQHAQHQVPYERVEPVRRVSINIPSTSENATDKPSTSTAKEESSENIYNLIANDTDSPGTSGTNTNEIPSTSSPDLKQSYETALQAINDEFHRLNEFFSENPNNSNLQAMTRLARELGKIRPVEKVQLESMELVANDKNKGKARKRRYSSSSDSDTDSSM